MSKPFQKETNQKRQKQLEDIWDAIQKDDVDALVRAAKDTNTHTNEFIDAANMVLVADNTPKKCMEEIAKHINVDLKWLATWCEAAEDEKLIDWNVAIAWVEANTPDKDKLRENVRLGLEWALAYERQHKGVSKEDIKQGNFDSERLDNVASACLDYDPTLLNDVKLKEIETTNLMDLMLSRPEKNWFRDGGADIQEFMSRALLGDWQRKHSKQVDLPDFPEKWDAWINREPERKTAWNTIEKTRKETWLKYDAWIDEWMNDGLFADSKLEQWVEKQQTIQDQLKQNAPTSLTISLKGSPLDHPFFDEDAQNIEDSMVEAVRYHCYKVFRDFRGGRGLNFEKMMAVNKFLTGACGGNQDRITHINVPTETLAWGLRRKSIWVDQEMAKTCSLKALYEMVAAPDTAGIFMRYDLKDVVRWLSNQPAWRSWRDYKGDNLMDNWLSQSRTKTIDNKWLIKDIRAIMRLAPEWLDGKEFGDASPAERLDLPDKLRAEIRMKILGKYAETYVVKRKAKVKM